MLIKAGANVRPTGGVRTSEGLLLHPNGSVLRLANDTQASHDLIVQAAKIFAAQFSTFHYGTAVGLNTVSMLIEAGADLEAVDTVRQSMHELCVCSSVH